MTLTTPAPPLPLTPLPLLSPAAALADDGAAALGLGGLGGGAGGGVTYVAAMGTQVGGEESEAETVSKFVRVTMIEIEIEIGAPLAHMPCGWHA